MSYEKSAADPRRDLIGADWRKRLAANGFALVISILALEARLALAPWVRDRPILILFILPIIFSAYVGGLWAGLLSTAFCAWGVYHFFLAPAHNLLFFEGSVDLWQWVMLMVIGTLISLLVEALHRSRAQIEAASRQLEESQALYHSLVEQVPAGIFRTDAAGRFVFVNPFLCGLRGSSPEQFLGKLPAELADARHPHFLHAAEHHAQIMRQGKAIEVQEELQHPDGRTVHLQVIKTPVFDAHGSVIGVQGILFDVTQRRQEAAALARSLALLRTTTEASTNGLLVVDLNHQITHFNTRFLEIMDLPRALAEAGDDNALLAQAQTVVTDPEAFLHRVRELQADPEKASLDILNLKNGRIIERVSHPQRLAETVIGRVWSFRDVTDQRKAEQQLQQLAVMVESSEEAIFGSNLAGIITSWNRGAETIFGYAAAEIVGSPDLPLYPPDQQAERVRMLLQIRRGEGCKQLRSERVRKDGKRIRISATISPLRDAHGTVIGAATIASDITHQHLLEEQLRQSQKMEAIGQLAGGVAHDFNNLLAVIQMQIELSHMDAQFTPEQEACLQEIETAAKRGANLTRQLLLFSRRQRLQPRELDLGDSILNMTKMLRRILGEDIRIQFKYASRPVFIQADAGMIDQVLMNLTLNSRDAMPNGGHLIIETAAVEMDELAVLQSAQARRGSFVRLSVSDTGSGIPPEILPRIFEPFFTTKDVGKGTGLGLATVFSIVQQHQGWINVSSEPGCGTTFDLYFPRLVKEPSPTAEAPATLAAVPGGHETILLVEDDDSLRASVRRCLAGLGYHLLEAATGVAALRLWQEQRPPIDLLLSDLVMPDGMSGKELGERLRQDSPQLKIIFVSGYSADLLTGDIQQDQRVKFLAKPFPAQALAQAVRACLDQP